jgi:hypothetical protein
MLWVATNDIQDAFAPDDFAVRTALFDRCRDFHNQFSFDTGPDDPPGGYAPAEVSIILTSIRFVQTQFHLLYGKVRIHGSASVTATVCSKWAVSEPSAETTVH